MTTQEHRERVLRFQEQQAAKLNGTFDGSTFDIERDEDRLRAQLSRVKQLMIDGKWRTLNAIAVTLHYPEASISARLRDLRKEKFGGYRVERAYVRAGLWEYRLVQP